MATDNDGSTHPSLIERYLLGKKEELQNDVVETIKEAETEKDSTPVTVSEKESTPITASGTDSVPLEENNVAVDVVEETNPHPTGYDNVVQSNESNDDSSTVSEVVSEEVIEDENSNAEVDVDVQEIKIETAPADFRFPTTNQTKHCFTRYVEYHRCIATEGEDAPGCTKFAKYYRSLCPGEWVDRWNEQRENGTFAGPL